jgi:acyl-CoA dehydrogenase
MIYGDEGGATGWLIGEENRGLACMFTMMNNARLAVGIQGLGVAERAYQHALAYALDRKQGRAPGRHRRRHEPHRPPSGHQAHAACHEDPGPRSPARSVMPAPMPSTWRTSPAEDGDTRKFWSERAGLLTPIAKALSTDFGVEVASLGVQIHGGMGFIEETGAAQHLRDARIAPIYEGTNGIQSIDLVLRKLPLSGGDHIKGFIAELKEIADEVAASNRPEFGATAERLSAAIERSEEATDYMLAAQAEGRVADALSGATPYLRRCRTGLGGALLAKGALRSGRRIRRKGSANGPCWPAISARRRLRNRRPEIGHSAVRRSHSGLRRRSAGILSAARENSMIRKSLEDGVQLLRLDRPEKKNALTGAHVHGSRRGAGKPETRMTACAAI